jgi:hypothetical protein
MKYLIMLSVLILTGCGEIYTYELDAIIKKCGGADKIHVIWVDGSYVKAYCINGTAVDSFK